MFPSLNIYHSSPGWTSLREAMVGDRALSEVNNKSPLLNGGGADFLGEK